MGNPSPRSPFGDLLAEMREEGATQASPRAASERSRSSARLGPEPDLRLEAGVVSGAAGEGQPRRPWRWAGSVVVHATLLAAVVALPLLRSDDLPAVAGAKVFLVLPVMAAPLPPPPAPRLAVATPRAEAPKPRPATLAAPLRVAPEVKPEELVAPGPPPALAARAEEGVPGGVDEGVPGGIVGGVLERAAVVEGPARSEVRAGVDVKEPRKLKNVEPAYPELAVQGKVEGVVLLELTILPSGRVGDVRVLRSIPLLDAAAQAAARQWVFAPTLVRGVPVGVLMTVSVRFGLRDGVVARAS